MTKRRRSARVSVAAERGRADIAKQISGAVMIERLQLARELQDRTLQVTAIFGQQQAAGMRALRHRQIGRRPLLGRHHLLETGENAEQRIRGPREIVHAKIPTAPRRDDGRRDDVGANRLQQQPDALFEQANTAHRVLRIHDGFRVENIGIEPGEVARVIGGGVRCARDEERLGHRKGAVHRVPVKVLDGRQRMMRLPQETIAEKIDRLKGVGDEGRRDALVKSILRDVIGKEISLFIRA